MLMDYLARRLIRRQQQGLALIATGPGAGGHALKRGRIDPSDVSLVTVHSQSLAPVPFSEIPRLLATAVDALFLHHEMQSALFSVAARQFQTSPVTASISYDCVKYADVPNVKLPRGCSLQ